MSYSDLHDLITVVLNFPSFKYVYFQLRALSRFDTMNVVQTEFSAQGFPEQERQDSDFHQLGGNGVLPAELDQKLCHLLIERQENQIEELESELHLAQDKLNEKEAELQALKDCVKRLTEFSLSTCSGRTFLPSLKSPIFSLVF